MNWIVRLAKTALVNDIWHVVRAGQRGRRFQQMTCFGVLFWSIFAVLPDLSSLRLPIQIPYSTHAYWRSGQNSMRTYTCGQRYMRKVFFACIYFAAACFPSACQFFSLCFSFTFYKLYLSLTTCLFDKNILRKLHISCHYSIIYILFASVLSGKNLDHNISCGLLKNSLYILKRSRFLQAYRLTWNKC